MAKKNDKLKRVLWIEDHPENLSAKSLFIDAETKNVATMDDAIREISGEHIYDYDTIVLDIDFENGLADPDYVISRLTKKIYLSKDQREKSFIINNGGYLLFLYLLESGYPSDHIAFLTGNGGIIKQFELYNNQNMAEMSKEDITDAYLDAWNEASALEDGWDLFESRISSLPVHDEYKNEDTLISCAELLQDGNLDELREFIRGINPPLVTGSVQNTGDMMIFRFHEANIESPVFFSKGENDIKGHNRSEALKWISENRTKNRVTRWLMMEASRHVEELFRDADEYMDIKVGSLFSEVEDADGNPTDPGIRSSFRQMYYTLDGLRSMEKKGPFYQGMATMLVPFDAKPKFSGDSALAIGNAYDKVQKMFARFSKQARNFSAHNLFGTFAEPETVLFILMGEMAAVLNQEQRKNFDEWFVNAAAEICEKKPYDHAANIGKVNELCANIVSVGKVSQQNLYLPDDISAYTAYDAATALGYNSDMTVKTEPSSSVREKFYVFVLAAYVIKWFDGMTEGDISKKYGKGIAEIFRISNEIVSEYTYPKAL